MEAVGNTPVSTPKFIKHLASTLLLLQWQYGRLVNQQAEQEQPLNYHVKATMRKQDV